MLTGINNKQGQCVAEQLRGWGAGVQLNRKGHSFLKEWGKLRGTDLGGTAPISCGIPHPKTGTGDDGKSNYQLNIIRDAQRTVTHTHAYTQAHIVFLGNV